MTGHTRRLYSTNSATSETNFVQKAHVIIHSRCAKCPLIQVLDPTRALLSYREEMWGVGGPQALCFDTSITMINLASTLD